MKASKKLVGAIAALAVAASLTVGTTFAWFSSQLSVSTGNVDMDVKSASDTLQVAVLAKDGNDSDANFKYVLTSAEVKAAIGSFTYMALTSADDGKTITVSEGGVAATEGYAEFKFVFRTNIDNASLILAETSSVSASSTSKTLVWEEHKQAPYNTRDYGTPITADTIETKAAYASRVAFLEGANAKVWAPYEELGTGANSTNTKDAPAGYYKENLASDYNISKGVAGATPVNVQNMHNRVYRAKDATTDDAVNVVAAFPTTKTGDYYQMTVSVKIWLEGTDGDCLDAILSDTFGVAFGFRAVDLTKA